MTSFVEAQGLNLNRLHSQDYDGAENMSGKTNGAAAIIFRLSSSHLSSHCASHTLNLAVVSSLDVSYVRNMIWVVNKVSTFFFAHPKQQRKLEAAIQTTQPTWVVLHPISCNHQEIRNSFH